MKVLILANNSGGLYRFRKELLKELINPNSFLTGNTIQKSDVYVSVPCVEFVDELKELGVHLIDTFIDTRGLNPINDFKLLLTYKKIIKSVKPNIVLTYTIKPNIYGGALCKFLKIPYIVNITGLGTAIENTGIVSKVLLKLYKFSLSSAKCVFFQNQKNKGFFEERGLIKSKVDILPGSGVNVEDYSFAEYPEAQDKVSFLFIGRIMKDKGIEEFLECAKFIKEKYPNTEFSLIGEFYEKEYEPLISELSEKGVISYYGMQKTSKDFIRSHHAIILPTYHEGLSNVLLESAAMGRPVIASDIPGCREVFDSGVTGIGFEPKSGQALIDATLKFLSLSYDERKEMGRKAREKIEKEFDRKIVINKYIDIIK
ncbi:MAG: glycosyltransferase family 4 protein [Abditibacteriota bacterium]|nr:glycosyltransferase family 4 protein [Abditibacteriota bacterium]